MFLFPGDDIILVLDLDRDFRALDGVERENRRLEIFVRDTNLELDIVMHSMTREIEARIPFYDILGQGIADFSAITIKEDSPTRNRCPNREDLRIGVVPEPVKHFYKDGRLGIFDENIGGRDHLDTGWKCRENSNSRIPSYPSPIGKLCSIHSGFLEESVLEKVFRTCDVDGIQEEFVVNIVIYSERIWEIITRDDLVVTHPLEIETNPVCIARIDNRTVFKVCSGHPHTTLDGDAIRTD